MIEGNYTPNISRTIDNLKNRLLNNSSTPIQNKFDPNIKSDEIQNALTDYKDAANKSERYENALKLANEFEGQFIGLMLNQMFTSLDDNEFGGGAAEENWRTLLVEEYGQMISESGGIGLAEQLVDDILKNQDQKLDVQL